MENTNMRWLPNPGNILFTLLVAGLLILTQRIWATDVPVSFNAPAHLGATTISYQGRLVGENGMPQNGAFDMSFAIYDASSGGNMIWGPESHSGVLVVNGLFDVGLGRYNPISANIWNGERHMQITINNEIFSPREPIRSVPIAGMALTVPDNSISNNKLVSGGRPEVVVNGVAQTALIQTGRVNNSVNTNPDYIFVTFNQAFKTGTTPRVVVSPNNHAGLWPQAWYVVLQDHQGFRIYRQGEYPLSWDWVAIGELE